MRASIIASLLLSSVVLATPVVKEQTNIQQSGVVADNAGMKNGDVNAHAQGDEHALLHENLRLGGHSHDVARVNGSNSGNAAIKADAKVHLLRKDITAGATGKEAAGEVAKVNAAGESVTESLSVSATESVTASIGLNTGIVSSGMNRIAAVTGAVDAATATPTVTITLPVSVVTSTISITLPVATSTVTVTDAACAKSPEANFAAAQATDSGSGTEPASASATASATGANIKVNAAANTNGVSATASESGLPAGATAHANSNGKDGISASAAGSGLPAGASAKVDSKGKPMINVSENVNGPAKENGNVAADAGKNGVKIEAHEATSKEKVDAKAQVV